MQEWQQHPDVLYCTPLMAPGQKVVGPEDGMPTWVCECMVIKPTVEEAIQFMTAIEQVTPQHIKPTAKTRIPARCAFASKCGCRPTVTHAAADVHQLRIVASAGPPSPHPVTADLSAAVGPDL